MIKHYVQLITVICALLIFIQESPAPVFSTFPGLKSLIMQSTDVVVADVVEINWKPSITGEVDPQFRILKNLKGKHQEKSIVTLKNFRFLLHYDTFEGRDFPNYGRYILFLEGDTNINAEGSSIFISSKSNLDNLDTRDVEGCIIQLR